MEWSIETIVFLFFIAFLAGWIDAVAGGGGLLTLCRHPGDNCSSDKQITV